MYRKCIGSEMCIRDRATNMVTSYFDPGTKLIYAIGAVVGLIGGIKVYNKFSSGDPDTSKTAKGGNVEAIKQLEAVRKRHTFERLIEQMDDDEFRCL